MGAGVGDGVGRWVGYSDAFQAMCECPCLRSVVEISSVSSAQHTVRSTHNTAEHSQHERRTGSTIMLQWNFEGRTVVTLPHVLA